MVDQLRSFASEVTRVAREVGTEGKLGGQAVVPGVAGTWKDLTDCVNAMAGNLTSQVRNIAESPPPWPVGTFAKNHRRCQRRNSAAQKTINTMVDQFNGFAAEVTRVAREVGTEGKLGGQAAGHGRSRDLERLDRQRQLHGRQPDGQVRNIAEVTIAVANGDLRGKLRLTSAAKFFSSKKRSIRWSTS